MVDIKTYRQAPDIESRRTVDWRNDPRSIYEQAMASSPVYDYTQQESPIETRVVAKDDKKIKTLELVYGSSDKPVRLNAIDFMDAANKPFMTGELYNLTCRGEDGTKVLTVRENQLFQLVKAFGLVVKDR